MKKISKYLHLVFFALLLTLPVNALAEDKPLVFTGYMEEDNLPVEGPQNLSLTLYDSATSTSNDNVLWSESATLLFVEGEFTVQLGANGANPLPDVLHEVEALYLGIQVGDDDEMSPRLSVAAVPFSKHAERATQVGTYDAAALEDLNQQLQTAKDGLADLVATLDGHDLDGIESDIQIQINNLNLLSETIDAVEAAGQLRVTGSCPEGQSIRAIAEDGSVTCEADDNTQLDETAVDSYVSDNGYAQIGQLFSGDFNDLTNVPDGLEDGDDNTNLTASLSGGLMIDSNQAIGLIGICDENQILKFDGTGWDCGDDNDGDTWLSDAEVIEIINQSGVLFSSDYNDLTNQPTFHSVATSGDYADLNHKPDFTGWDTNASDDFDGDYNSLSGKPNFTGWDTNASDDFDGEYNSLNGKPNFTGWDTNASDDFDGEYNSLNGKPDLFSGSYDDLTNTPSFTGWDTNASDDFSGDFGDLANIPDDLADGDHNNIYVAGDGLMVAPDMNSNDNQSTLAVDTSVIQNRVTGSCPAGQSIRAIDADGNVTCETDTDTNTTYDGTNFALSNLSCGAGEVMKGVNDDGTPNCVADQSGSSAGPGFAAFTSSGSFTVPDGVTKIQIELWGGGGGGGGGSEGNTGQTGGKGGYLKNIIEVTPGHTISVTIGSGGGGGDWCCGGGAGAGSGSSIVSGGVTYLANGGAGGSYDGYGTANTGSISSNDGNSTVQKYPQAYGLGGDGGSDETNGNAGNSGLVYLEW